MASLEAPMFLAIIPPVGINRSLKFWDLALTPKTSNCEPKRSIAFINLSRVKSGPTEAITFATIYAAFMPFKNR